MRKIVFLLIFSLAGLAPTSPTWAGYGTPDEIWKSTESMYANVLTDNSALFVENQSYIQAANMPDRLTGKGGGNYVCETFDDPNCQDKEWVNGILLMSPCSVAPSNFCIEGLSIGSQTGASLTEVKATSEVNTKRVNASTNSGVPGGGAASLWRDSQYGDFLIISSLKYVKQKSEAPRFSSINTKIIPVTVKSDPAYVSSSLVTSNASESSIPNVQWQTRKTTTLSQSDCYVVDDGNCFVRRDFKEDTRLKISLTVPSEISGWLFGRMKNTAISLKPVSEKISRLEVTGTSAIAPNLIVSKTKAEVLKHEKYVAYTKANGYNGGEDEFERLRSPGSVVMGGGLVNAFWAYDVWGDELKAYSGPDPLFALSTAWNFGSIDSNQINGACANGKRKFLGMVTTNAPIYESDPPQLKDGFLQYRVAGPHFAADQKTLFRGVYDLNLDSEFARCIYGFTTAPISATISVTSPDGGSQEISTEVMSEKDGWIHLGAYNFHFSAPTVRVKFTQESAKVTAAPKATTKVLPKGSAPIKKTITCQKGTLKKKVTATKCPSGYKKIG